LKYAFIADHRSIYRITTMCAVLGAQKAGYYAWLKRQPSAREVRDGELRGKIVVIHEESRKRYGAPRIHAKLRELNERCGRKRVARLMKQEGLRVKRRRAFTPKTTDSKHEYPIAENLVQRRFSPEEIGAPNRCWAGDITYIRTGEGWLYLAVVLDLFSRMVIGWSMSSSMESRFVLDALEMAIARRGVPHDLIWHSDRGVQYASTLMRRLLEKHGIRCSMSAKGDCWDNAVSESFWSTLKAELFADGDPETRELARAAIFEFIEIWYNRERLHSTLGYVTPEQFELKAVA
jgi:transposase InsO family protein